MTDVLTEALGLVTGARQADYGTPAENHGRTAAMWSAFLGVPITPAQVCWCMVLMKASREANAPKRDNRVDAAGWAYNADVVSEPVPTFKGVVCGLCGAEGSLYYDPTAPVAWLCGPCADERDSGLVSTPSQDASGRMAAVELSDELDALGLQECERCGVRCTARVCATCD